MKHKILLDMDGVIADFIGGICRYHKLPNPYTANPDEHRWSIEEIWGMSKADMWTGVKAEFWEDLRQLPEATKIVEVCTEAVGVENIYICTTPPDINSGEAVQGKLRWLRWNFPQLAGRTIFTKEKHMCAGRFRYLVDDNDTNCGEFMSYGGNPILVPRPWNSDYKLDTYTMVEIGLLNSGLLTKNIG